MWLAFGVSQIKPHLFNIAWFCSFDNNPPSERMPQTIIVFHEDHYGLRFLIVTNIVRGNLIISVTIFCLLNEVNLPGCFWFINYRMSKVVLIGQIDDIIVSSAIVFHYTTLVLSHRNFVIRWRPCEIKNKSAFTWWDQSIFCSLWSYRKKKSWIRANWTFHFKRFAYWYIEYQVVLVFALKCDGWYMFSVTSMLFDIKILLKPMGQEKAVFVLTS